MIGVHRFDMRGTPRTLPEEIYMVGVPGLAADVQLEKTQFAPRGRGSVPD